MNGLEVSSVVLGVREVPRWDKVPDPVRLFPSFLSVTLFGFFVRLCWEKATCSCGLGMHGQW